jgi:hypothetical protein
MEKKEIKTAKEAYRAAKNDIANLLDWFDCEMGKDEPKEIDWAVVGSLQKVRSDLIEALASLSGFEQKQIQESLEDLNERTTR